MASFTRTFLERDIPGLGSRVSPAALGRFWRMLAHGHGQVWNASDLARSMDVSVTAVNHYRDLLAGAFMTRVLPPWFENLGKRLVKSPKVYLRDSGVLHFLLGVQAMRDLTAHPRYGGSWEGFALECQRSSKTDKFLTLIDLIGSGTRFSVDLDVGGREMAVGAVGNRVLGGFPSSLWARSLRPWGATASTAPALAASAAFG